MQRDNTGRGTVTGSNGKRKRISTQLLMVLLPMITVFVIVPAMVIYVNSKNTIVDNAKLGL